MPDVKLIYFTGKDTPDEEWYATRLLAFTKNTRLQMTPDGFDNFKNVSPEWLAEEIAYMTTTIPSSWEFVDLIFAINNVSRATAQQITRTRTATFAMQSQRVTDMREVTWDSHGEGFDESIEEAIKDYKFYVDNGMPLEDARDLLPIGVHCNLVAKYNLRSFVELVRARNSLRAQGPYREVARQMKEEVLNVWPWAGAFMVPPQQKSIEMIEEVAQALAAAEGEKGAMYKGLSGKLAKAADLLKK